MSNPEEFPIGPQDEPSDPEVIPEFENPAEQKVREFIEKGNLYRIAESQLKEKDEYYQYDPEDEGRINEIKNSLVSAEMRDLDNLSEPFAQYLISHWYDLAVVENLDKFQSLSPETERKLLSPRTVGFISKNKDLFPHIEQKDVVENLVHAKFNLQYILDRYPESDKNHLVKLLVENERTNELFDSRGQLDKDFENIDRDAIARAIEEAQIWDVHEFIRSLNKYLKEFPLDQDKIIDKIFQQEVYGFSPKDLAATQLDIEKVLKRILAMGTEESERRMDRRGTLSAYLEAKYRDKDRKDVLALPLTDDEKFEILLVIVEDFSHGNPIGYTLGFIEDEKLKIKLIANITGLNEKIVGKYIENEYGIRFLQRIQAFKKVKESREIRDRMREEEYDDGSMERRSYDDSEEGQYYDKFVKLSELEKEAAEKGISIQELLKEYGRNKEILKEAESKGIDTKEWLNHPETEIFTLGEGEGSFFQQVRNPLIRIPRDMNAVLVRVKQAKRANIEKIKQIKIEESPEDKVERQKEIEAVNKQIETLKEKIIEATDKKKSSLEKALENAQSKVSKLEIPKQRNAEDALNGSITNFRGARKALFGKIKDLARLERKEKELEQAVKDGSTPDAKEVYEKFLQEKKKNEGGLRNEIFRSIKSMESRYGELSDVLHRINQGVTTGETVFDIQNTLGEQIDHLKSDVSQIEASISNAENKIAGDTMEIGVWKRNLEEDVLLGNYTDCCVRVDSEYHDTSLPILDYLADLGIQIIVVRDKTKDKPVYAAWSWLGENNKQETALVIDNIEGNPQYAALYQDVMKQKIFDYAIKYGQKIKANKVVLGLVNNDIDDTDLPLESSTGKEVPRSFGTQGSTMDVEEKTMYEKLGGEADDLGRGEGYYLEAEDNSAIGVIADLRVSGEFKPLDQRERRFKAMDDDWPEDDYTEEDWH